ncbi:MAG: radical SAM protein [Geobacteraceae bacterium]
MNNNTNGIHGWLFSAEDIANANRDNRLLTLDFELGDVCPLKCIYCYRSYDSRDNDVPAPRKKPLMDLTEWRRVVDEAKQLGVKSIKLIGGGEITEEKEFISCLEYIAERDITVVLFTAGTVLGDDELCRSIHGIGSMELATWLHDKIGASVFVKMDSLDQELQDSIAGSSGYALVRDRAYQLLKDVGFNKHNPTRLGLEVNVGRQNVHEIMDIYALRTRDNVYEDVVTSMPCDTYYRNTNYDISIEEKRDLYRKVYSYNKQHGIPYEKISPFIGGLECSQLGNGLYVTNRGDVYHCPGSFEEIGNTKEESLVSIWSRFSEARKYQSHYFCPFREQAQILPTDLIRELETELLENHHPNSEIDPENVKCHLAKK